MTQPPQFLQPQWFVPLFLCLWLVVCAVSAHLGGWHSLSKEYRTKETIQGEHFRFASGSMGRWPFPVTAYGSCLFLTVNDSGFRLSILFVFRFLSPALFIPWSAVKTVEDRRFLFARYTLIRLTRGWPTVSVRGRAGQYISRMYGKASGAP